MKHYLKYMPYLAVVLSFAVFGTSIIAYENHLTTGKVIYVELAPVDPRSILQGDYMQLEYNIPNDYDVVAVFDKLIELESQMRELSNQANEDYLVENNSADLVDDMVDDTVDDAVSETANDEPVTREYASYYENNEEYKALERAYQEQEALKDTLYQQIEDKLNNAKRFTAYVQLDKDNKLIDMHLDPMPNTMPLQLTRPSAYGLWGMHPAVDSFMFAEGLGTCYEQAKFAKLSVADDGAALLVDLVGEHFAPLDCTKGRSWTDGFVRAKDSTP
ncbi:MAG: GDYXXLXY domain-containing protein [Moraxella sp.]|nr:GDYXXLXY domain-containing protein [Moraxella sp.]